MKQSIRASIVWLLTGAFIVGCGIPTSSSETENETTNKTEVSESTTEETTNVPNNATQGTEIIPVAYEGDFFTWCDSEQKVYASCQNVDKDIYPDVMGGAYYFQIMSLEHVDPEDIEIILPIETDYFVAITEDTEMRETKWQNYLRYNEGAELGYMTVASSTGEAYPYVLYHCYKGTDWNTMLELYLAAEKADNSKLEVILGGGSTSNPVYQNANSIQEAYDLYNDQYRDAFKALTSDDLPLFYYYKVTITFGISNFEYITDDAGDIVDVNITDGIVKMESLETIEIKMGEKTYRQNIGQIRIHDEDYLEFDELYGRYLYDNEEIKYIEGGIPSVVSNGGNYPWGNGIACIEDFNFRTMVDMTLTSCSLFAGPCDVEILGAHVQAMDSNGTGIDFYWDLQSPVTLEAGKDVVIHIFFKDSDLGKMEYNTTFGFVLEYETDGKIVQKNKMIEFDRYRNMQIAGYSDYSDSEEIGAPWLRYAVIFDGLDMESYFNDYFRQVNETWRWNLPW